MNVAEYLSIILLILLSFMTLRARERYFRKSQSAYQYVLAGLCALLIVPLVRILNTNGWLEGAPVLGQEANQDYLEVLLLLLGGIAITVGLIQRIRSSGTRQEIRVLRRTVERQPVTLPTRFKGAEQSMGVNEHSNRGSLHTTMKELQMKLAEAEQISEVIQVLDQSLRPHLKHEILRLAIYDARGLNITQYCLGPSGNLLTERNRSISTSRTQLGLLYTAPQITRCHDLGSSPFSDDEWISSCGARTSVTYPLLLNGQSAAMLTLAFAGEEPDHALQDTVIAGLSPALISLVKCDTISHQLLCYNRQILDLIGALKRMSAPEQRNSNLFQLAQIIAKKLPATSSRFWKCVENEDVLELVSKAEIREGGNKESVSSRFPLRQAYWHRLALSSGRVMLIQQRDERMRMDDHEMEMSLLSGSQSAMLVPLRAGKKTLGILSVGEQRNWERRSFSLPETIFVRAIGSIAAHELASSHQEEISSRLVRKVEKLELQSCLSDLFAELPQRLVTPITSIMARSEQLLKSETNKESPFVQNLGIINRQAEKIADEVRKIQEVRRQQVFG